MQDRDRGFVEAAREQAGLVHLDRATCLELLRTASIGRVIYTDSALPAAQPVNFMLDDEEVVFRTGGGGKLVAAARNAVVGFQTDELDPTTRTGWTVLGVGEAYEVTEPQRLTALRGRLPEPWVWERTDHTICIPLQQLTGRRVVVAAWIRPDSGRTGRRFR
jgi:nitroimidazol reductase NimA-like FMN-containing flavoprotein (pyridoxamine 5'-phosphate oxidase superfamily)